MEKFEGDLYWYRIQSAAARACGLRGRPQEAPPTLDEVDRLLSGLSHTQRNKQVIAVEDALLDMRQIIFISSGMDAPVPG